MWNANADNILVLLDFTPFSFPKKGVTLRKMVLVEARQSIRVQCESVDSLVLSGSKFPPGRMLYCLTNLRNSQSVFKDLMYREGLNGGKTFDWTLKKNRLSLDCRRKNQEQNQQQPDNFSQQQRQQGYAEDAGATGEYLGRHHHNHEASATESDVEMKPSPTPNPEEHDNRPLDTNGIGEEGSKSETVEAQMPAGANHARSPTQEDAGSPVELPYPGSPSTKSVNPSKAEHSGLKTKEKFLQTREQGIKWGHERRHGWRSEEEDARRYSSVPVGGSNGASEDGGTFYGFIHQAGAGVPAEIPASGSAPLVDRYTRTEPPPGTTSLLFPPLASLLPPTGVLGQNGAQGKGGHLVSPGGRPSSEEISGSRNGSSSGGGGSGNGTGGSSSSGIDSGSFPVIQTRLIQPNNHRVKEEIETSRAEAVENNDNVSLGLFFILKIGSSHSCQYFSYSIASNTQNYDFFTYIVEHRRHI